MSPDFNAVVVFSGQTELPALHLLAPGFRHCFIALALGGAWVVINPLAHRTTLELLPASLGLTAGAVAAFFADQGLIAVPCTTQEPPRCLAPLRPYSCVEEVKRLLGLHAPAILTPRQLYRTLAPKRKDSCDRILFLTSPPTCATSSLVNATGTP